MDNNYVFYINNNIDYYFNDIGHELFKLAISLSYSNNNNKKFIISDNNYLKILEVFLNLSFNYIDINNINYNSLILSNTNENNNKNNSENECIIKMDFSFKNINNEIRDLLSYCLLSNPRYTTIIYNKINDIMNFFKDYDINNYVCIFINKNNYNKYYYERAYYNYFSNCKLIILTDDINWSIKNITFIKIENIYFIINDYSLRFINFILFIHFNKIIVDINNYYTLFIAFLGNKNKKVIIPNEISNNYYLDNWFKQ